jgi:hypothetical protein
MEKRFISPITARLVRFQAVNLSATIKAVSEINPPVLSSTIILSSKRLRQGGCS